MYKAACAGPASAPPSVIWGEVRGERGSYTIAWDGSDVPGDTFKQLPDGCKDMSGSYKREQDGASPGGAIQATQVGCKVRLGDKTADIYGDDTVVMHGAISHVQGRCGSYVVTLGEGVFRQVPEHRRECKDLSGKWLRRTLEYQSVDLDVTQVGCLARFYYPYNGENRTIQVHDNGTASMSNENYPTDFGDIVGQSGSYTIEWRWAQPWNYGQWSGVSFKQVPAERHCKDLSGRYELEYRREVVSAQLTQDGCFLHHGNETILIYEDNSAVFHGHLGKIEGESGSYVISWWQTGKTYKQLSDDK